MKYARLLLTSVALLGSLGCSRKPSLTFGIVDGDAIRETTKIEHRVGNKYGYRISFPSSRGVVKIKEEFALPAAASIIEKKSTKPDLDQKEPGAVTDQKTVVRQVEFDTDGGNDFFSSYEIIEGDPKGLHRIKLWLNGDEFRTIQFTVE